MTRTGRTSLRAIGLLVAGASLLAPATLFAQPAAGAGNVCLWSFLRPTLGEGSGTGGALTVTEAENTLIENLEHVCTQLQAEDLPTGCADGTVLEALSGGLTCGAVGGGGTLTVQEVDGTPSGVASTLEFDQADGLELTDQGAGSFRLDLAAIPLARLAATLSGSTTVLATVSGSLVTGNCLEADASGNVVDAGAACGTGGGGTLTVQEVDGAPSGVASTLRLDQADGFVLTDETGGVFRLDLANVPLSVLAEDVLTEVELDSEAKLEALIGVGVVTVGEADQIGTTGLDDGAATPAAGDLLRVAAGAEQIEYVTPHAGTDITTDLEEENHVAEHQAGGDDELSIAGLSGQAADAQPVTVELDGVAVGTRPRINFIEGSNVTLTVADDPGGDEVDVTIAAAATGGTVVVKEVDGSPSVTASTIEIDQAAGLTVTDQGSGVARISSTSGGGSDPWAGQYHPDRKPSSGLVAASSDEFDGGFEATWRWGNQGSATDTAALDTGFMEGVGNGSTNLRVRWLDAPTGGTDFIVAAKVSPAWDVTLTAAGDNLCGILALVTGSEATPTAIRGLMFRLSSSGQVHVRHGSTTGYTVGFSLVKDSAASATQSVMPLYLLAKYLAGSNTLSTWLSGDGTTWLEMGTETLAGHPISVGRLVSSLTNGTYAGCRTHWFRTCTSAACLDLEVGE